MKMDLFLRINGNAEYQHADVDTDSRKALVQRLYGCTGKRRRKTQHSDTKTQTHSHVWFIMPIGRTSTACYAKYDFLVSKAEKPPKFGGAKNFMVGDDVLARCGNVFFASFCTETPRAFAKTGSGQT